MKNTLTPTKYMQAPLLSINLAGMNLNLLAGFGMSNPFNLDDEDVSWSNSNMEVKVHGYKGMYTVAREADTNCVFARLYTAKGTEKLAHIYYDGSTMSETSLNRGKAYRLMVRVCAEHDGRMLLKESSTTKQFHWGSVDIAGSTVKESDVVDALKSSGRYVIQKDSVCYSIMLDKHDKSVRVATMLKDFVGYTRTVFYGQYDHFTADGTYHTLYECVRTSLMVIDTLSAIGKTWSITYTYSEYSRHEAVFMSEAQVLSYARDVMRIHGTAHVVIKDGCITLDIEDVLAAPYTAYSYALLGYSTLAEGPMKLDAGIDSKEHFNRELYNKLLKAAGGKRAKDKDVWSLGIGRHGRYAIRIDTEWSRVIATFVKGNSGTVVIYKGYYGDVPNTDIVRTRQAEALRAMKACAYADAGPLYVYEVFEDKTNILASQHYAPLRPAQTVFSLWQDVGPGQHGHVLRVRGKKERPLPVYSHSFLGPKILPVDVNHPACSVWHCANKNEGYNIHVGYNDGASLVGLLRQGHGNFRFVVVKETNTFHKGKVYTLDTTKLDVALAWAYKIAAAL